MGVEQGGSASFTVEASGAGLTYLWFGPDGVALTDSDGEIEGSTSGTLTVFNAEPDDAGNYTVVVTNSAGSVTSDAASLSIGEILNMPIFLRLSLCLCGGHACSCFTCLCVQVLQLTYNRAM